MKVQIQKENNTDYTAVRKVHQLAFGQDNEANLVTELRKSKSYIPDLSLVARVDRKIVGHILLTEILIVDNHNHKTVSLALAPMAVFPEFQKKGIGAQLINSSIQKARDMQYKSIIVLGHPQYYPKFGFQPAIQWKIKPPFDVPSHAFMALELVTDGLANTSGMVIYPKEFDIV